MKAKIIFFIIFLLTSKVANGLETTNQLGQSLTVITQYSNEDYLRVYKELSPILLELLKRKPTLILDFENLKSIKFYLTEKIQTTLKTVKMEETTDSKNNKFFKLSAKDQNLLPKPLLEITGKELKDQKYIIMPDAANKPTYIQINPNPITKTDKLALLW